jgi:NitT/TauT family transport system substrate-binding protein
VGIISLFEHPPQIPGFDVKIEALAQQDLMAARFISGEAKVGILPPNMAAKIASSGKTSGPPRSSVTGC